MHKKHQGVRPLILELHKRTKSTVRHNSPNVDVPCLKLVRSIFVHYGIMMSAVAKKTADDNLRVDKSRKEFDDKSYRDQSRDNVRKAGD